MERLHKCGPRAVPEEVVFDHVGNSSGNMLVCVGRGEHIHII